MIVKNNLNTLTASIVVEVLKKHGITEFIISPGSRSTPIILAIGTDDELNKTIIYDERAAAYFAVNYSRAMGRPAVLVCTSGTAVANYLPAITEAEKDEIPVIILTADRPEELQNVGANQTISQENIFNDFSKYSATIEASDNITNPAKISGLTINAIFSALKNSSPVHINCRFRKPLESKVELRDDVLSNFLEEIKSIKSDKISPEYQDIPDKIIAEITNISNGLIVVGRLNNNTDIRVVEKIINKLKFPTIVDISSGLSGASSKYIIKYHDLLLMRKNVPEPNFILHLGNQLVSANYLNFIKNIDCNFIQINQSIGEQDPGRKVKMKLKADLRAFEEKLTELEENDYFLEWKEIESKILSNIPQNESNINEIIVSEFIAGNLPETDCLYLSSSMPIRNFDKFTSLKNQNLVGCNRGVSGIDGTIASAVGFSYGLNRNCTLVIGDLAFIHDMNSLYLVSQSKKSITIVILNNHGGGIFSHLPISEHQDVFNKYYTTPHELSFEFAAKMFSIDYQLVKSKKEFFKVYNESVDSSKSMIIEVDIDPEINIQYFKKIYQNILNVD